MNLRPQTEHAVTRAACYIPLFCPGFFVIGCLLSLYWLLQHYNRHGYQWLREEEIKFVPFFCTDLTFDLSSRPVGKNTHWGWYGNRLLEGNVWAYDRGSNRRLDTTTQWEPPFHSVLLGWSMNLTDSIVGKDKVHPCTGTDALCTGCTAHRGSRRVALLFLDHSTRRVWGQRHAPAALYLRERRGTHCTGCWVGPRAGLDGRKISSPPGFDPRTDQPVASRYTVWATRPTTDSIRYIYSQRRQAWKNYEIHKKFFQNI